ncbi:hypothetical protein HK405_012920, partial [Cladochytrium tenue]
ALATLNDKENDLVVAAEIGQQLLKANKELVSEYDRVCLSLVQVGQVNPLSGEDVLRRSLNRTLSEALAEHPSKKAIEAIPAAPRKNGGGDPSKLSSRSQRNLKYIAKLEQENMELSTTVATLTAELKLAKVNGRKMRRQVDELKKNAESFAEREEASASRLRQRKGSNASGARVARGNESDLGDVSSSTVQRREESREIRQIKIRLAETERQLLASVTALEESSQRVRLLEEFKQHDDVLIEKLQKNLREVQDALEEERRLFAAAVAGVLPPGVPVSAENMSSALGRRGSLLADPRAFFSEIDSTAESEPEDAVYGSAPVPVPARPLRARSSTSSMLQGDAASRRISITFRRKPKAEKAALIFDRVIGSVKPTAAARPAGIFGALAVTPPGPTRQPLPLSSSPGPVSLLAAAGRPRSRAGLATLSSSPIPEAAAAVEGADTLGALGGSLPTMRPTDAAGGGGGVGSRHSATAGLLSPLSLYASTVSLGLSSFGIARDRMLQSEAARARGDTLSVPIANYLRAAKVTASSPPLPPPSHVVRPLGALRSGTPAPAVAATASAADAVSAPPRPTSSVPIAYPQPTLPLPPPPADDLAAASSSSGGATTAVQSESEGSESSEDGATGSNLLDRLFRRWVGLAAGAAPPQPSVEGDGQP